MIKYSISLSILIAIICGFTACHKDSKQSAFYYWKTSYKQDSLSNSYIQQLGSSKLYLRIMDIDYDISQTQAIPISPITYQDSLPQDQEIIPVVFINQRIFQTLDSFAIRTLAHKIQPFISAKLAQAGVSSFQELQLDCDWTKSSRDKFFYFIEFLKSIPELSSVEITSTLRLHQVKNIQSAGIPPVDRVALMCYNMGNLRKFGNHNSILNKTDLELYLKDALKNYPLQVDIALPLFEWFVTFRNNEYTGIAKRLSREELFNDSLFTKNPNTDLYILKVDLPEVGLKKNDIVRHEYVNSKELQETSKFLQKNLKTPTSTVIFYHLDPDVISNFTTHDLQQIIKNL